MSQLVQWAIMSKDRKFIAAGATRNRCLESIEDVLSGKVKKRILLYGTESKARSGFTGVGFYGQSPMFEAAVPNYIDMSWTERQEYNLKDYLEPVKMTLNY